MQKQLVMKNFKIVLLENNGEEIEKISELLNQCGFDTTLGKDGLEGLRILYNTTPDLIIANTKLPLVDGFDILKTVKSNNRLAEVPFILTANVLEHHKIHMSKRLGADAYIKRPSSFTLLYAIKRCLGLEMLVGC